MLRGRLVADADPSTVTPEDLGSAMTGAGSTSSAVEELAVEEGEN
jgi:simple sugar transport system ATP-binding protein